MPRKMRSTAPALVREDPKVVAVLAAIDATEAEGQNLTTEQYYELSDAVENVLAAHPELATQEPLDDMSFDLVDRDLDLAGWIVTGALLAAHRGGVDAPSGQHGPWPGSRCVYCGSNNLDVDLYTVDPEVCPPVWACGAHHPDSGSVDIDTAIGLSHCGLEPDHEEDHRFEFPHWPMGYDPDAEVEERADAARWGMTVNEETVGLVPAQGPPLLEVLTWPRSAAELTSAE